MKFELKEPKYCYSNTVDHVFDDTWFEIYITKGEFIKNYEMNTEKAYKMFSQLVEMYVTPHCFSRDLSFIAFEKIYKELKSKSKYKGLMLSITEEMDYSINELGQEINDLCIELIS